MSVELEIRILTPFTLAALLHRTTELADTMLPYVPIRMIGPTADYIRHGTAAPIPPEQLAATCGPGVQQPAPVLIAAGDGIIEATSLDLGSPDDPELGVWINISAGVVRGPASRLLAALAGTAAAQLAHSDVIDDYGILGHHRVNPPEPLADALRHAGTTTSTTAAPGTNEHAEALLGALTADLA